MNYKNEVNALAEPLRQAVLAHFTDEDHASVGTLLAEHMAAHSPASATVLVALACATFLEAHEVMVDDVIPASRKALALLDQASALPNANVKRIQSLRREVQGVLNDALIDERNSALTAQTAIDQGIATADDLADQAFRAWKKRDWAVAAQLFLRAAAQETIEAQQRSSHARPDRSMNYIARATQCLAGCGDFAAAQPLFERVINFDWQGGRLWQDRHVVEWAFASILYEHARTGDWAGFELSWHQAIDRCAGLDMSFPFIHPIQERLLALCMDHGQTRYLPRLIAQVEARSSRVPKDLRSTLAKAKALVREIPS